MHQPGFHKLKALHSLLGHCTVLELPLQDEGDIDVELLLDEVVVESGTEFE